MRVLLVAGVLAMTSTAHAERTVLTVGGVFGARSNDTYDSAGRQQADLFGGGRLMLSFEDPPPEPDMDRIGMTSSGRLVPELLVGFQAFEQKAEGMIGAGLRAELQVASHGQAPRPVRLRAAFYVAARAEVIGQNHDPAGELVLGEYLWFPGGRGRIGLDGGLVVRRDSQYPDAGLGAVLTGYVAWAL